jgi:hypothetical protein
MGQIKLTQFMSALSSLGRGPKKFWKELGPFEYFLGCDWDKGYYYFEFCDRTLPAEDQNFVEFGSYHTVKLARKAANYHYHCISIE